MKIMLGLPTISGQYDVYVIQSILNQLPYINENHITLECNVIQNTLIHNARNTMAQNAIEKECDYLFFLDSDCVLPNDTLKTLVEHDKDIVAGMYFQKRVPFPPVIYTENKKGTYDVITDYPKDSLIEVDGVGMGVCLIKTSVFKYIPTPFNPIIGKEGEKSINGEDLAFCKRAKEKGFKIYVDTAIQALHQTVRYIDETYYLKSMKILKEKENGNHPTTGGNS